MTPALTAALQLPVLSADETTRLLEAAKSGDGAARDRIVLHSLRFVVLRMRVWCAWLDRVTGDQAREDALLEGVEGLYDAIDHYDVTRGAWTTCAVWWIDDRLRDFAWDEISLVRIPNKRRKSAHRLEVAQLLHSVRLDDVGHPDGDKARGTRLDAQAAPPDAPDEQQAQSAAAQAVDELLARLDDEQQRWLFRRRFIDLASLKEIGAELHVTREAARLRLLRITKTVLELAGSPLTVKQFTRLWTHEMERPYRPQRRRVGPAGVAARVAAKDDQEEPRYAAVIPIHRRRMSSAAPVQAVV